jgi:creatinine amidohydrolase
MMRTRQVELLRPSEIKQALREAPVAYLPIGPLEWHGPQGMLGTDPLNAQNIAREAADRTGGIVFPTLFMGTERERSPSDLEALGFEHTEWIVGMDFPANSLPSLYITEEVLALALREFLQLVPRWGVRLAVVVNGHGATNHLNAIQRLVNEFNASGQIRYIHFFPYLPDKDGNILVGHAAKLETSLMMALYPDAINLDEIPPKPQPMYYRDWAVVDWYAFIGRPTPNRTIAPDDDPRDASATYGRQYMDHIVSILSERVREELGASATQTDEAAGKRDGNAASEVHA